VNEFEGKVDVVRALINEGKTCLIIREWMDPPNFYIWFTVRPNFLCGTCL